MHSLQEAGFIKAKLNPFNLSTKAQLDLEMIHQNFDTLPKDPYAPNDCNRFRAYSNLIIIPWERKIHWIPPVHVNGNFLSGYWQGKFNPEHKDAIRYFTPLLSETRNTLFLKNLIMHDFDLTFWNSSTTLPIYVGIHFVKLLVSDKNQIAFSSPDLLHRDGEAFTFAHLFKRFNVKGGTNYISKPEYANKKINEVDPNNILDKFEMYDQLDTYGVCDQLVSHYVSPVAIDDGSKKYGSREIILI